MKQPANSDLTIWQIDFTIKSSLWLDSSLLNLHSSSHMEWTRTSQLRHEIMQLLLFVVDKVDTCVCLDIDELLLIGPEIEHLVFKNSTKLQKKFYWVHEKCVNPVCFDCFPNTFYCYTSSALYPLNGNNNRVDIFLNQRQRDWVEIEISKLSQKIQTRSYRVHEKYLHIFEIWMKDIARNSISTSAWLKLL